MGAHRVAIDPEAFGYALVAGRGAGDALQSAAQRLARVCETAGIATAAGPRIDGLGTALRARVVGLAYVHRGALAAQASQPPPLPDWAWHRNLMRWIHRTGDKIRNFIVGIPNGSVFEFLLDQPVDPIPGVSIETLFGLPKLRYRNVLHPSTLRQAGKRPKRPSLFDYFVRVARDGEDFHRQLLRLLRRQEADWIRRVRADLGWEAPSPQFRGTGNRVMVLTGLGSDSNDRIALDWQALGYSERRDVRYFSYNPDGPTFTAAESSQDIDRSARALDHQMRDMKRRDPDRGVDLIGYSEGGVVMTYWLKTYYRPNDPAYPKVTQGVTIASPLQGTPPADLDVVGNANPMGERLIRTSLKPFGGSLPANHAAAPEQMSTTSPIIDQVMHAPMPDGVQLHAIAAATDYVVPANRAALPGVRPRVINTVDPLDAHGSILRTPETTAEIQRALSGEPERFHGFPKEFWKVLAPKITTEVEDGFGIVLRATAFTG